MQPIELPEAGFTPKASAGVTSELGDFFTRAWEQFQTANPEVDIRDDRVVRGLRLAWYDYLEAQGYKRPKCSAAASAWYKRAKDNTKYHRDSYGGDR